MKRVIISVVILAAVLAGAALEAQAVSTQTDRCRKSIEQADALLRDGDLNQAAVCCQLLEAEWRQAATHFHMLLMHDDTDNVGTGIARMRVYAANGSRAEYFAESAGVKKGLASIKGSEYPLLENIL